VLGKGCLKAKHRVNSVQEKTLLAHLEALQSSLKITQKKTSLVQREEISKLGITRFPEKQRKPRRFSDAKLCTHGAEFNASLFKTTNN